MLRTGKLQEADITKEKAGCTFESFREYLGNQCSEDWKSGWGCGIK